MEIAQLWRVRTRVVGLRGRKDEFARSGGLADTVATLVIGDPPARRLAADIVGSMARGASPATLLALLRTDALACTLYALRCARGDEALVMPLVQAVSALVRALADHVAPSPRWGIGYDWGRSSLVAMSKATEESFVYPMRGSWDASPSMEQMRSYLVGRIGVLMAAVLRGSDQIEYHLHTTDLIDAYRSEARHADSLGDHTALVWLARRAIVHLYTTGLEQLLSALFSADPAIGEGACSVLACSAGISMGATTYEYADRCARIVSFRPRADTDVLTALAALATCGIVHIQQEALWALAEITACPDVAARLCATRAGQYSALDSIAAMTHCTSELSVAACAVLVNVARAGLASKRDVLALLVVLLSFDVRTQVQAYFVIVCLLRDNEPLQTRAVLELHIFAHIAASLDAHADDSEMSVRLREGCLSVLATMAFESDAMRQRIIESFPTLLRGVVVPALVSPAHGLHIAACRLIRALSRTLGILRTSLYDAGVAAPLLTLFVQTTSERVRSEVIAALCNLLVKHSPIKTYLLEHGVLEHLCECTHGHTGLGALWALRNALWESDASLKRACMDLLGWDYLAELLALGGPISEQAFGIVRNLTSAGGNAQADISMAMDGLGERLFAAAEYAAWRNDVPTLVQAAFVLVNVASGSDAHKALIYARPRTLEMLCLFMQHDNPLIREAGVRCGANLTHSQNTSAVGALRRCGYEQLLGNLKNDACLNVRDHVHMALLGFVL